MDYVSLGNIIKQKRFEMNLTQEKLAEKAKISTAYMGQIERAEKHISLENFVNIANVLNCSTDELLHRSTINNINSKYSEIISYIQNLNSREIEKIIEIIKILSK